MHYGDNKPKYIRRAIYALLIGGAVLLQNSCGGLLEIFGARVLLVLPLCVSVAMFEREVTAALFGALAGVLWDISSSADGFNAIVIMIICAICSLLISHLMRNNVLTALVLSSGGVAAYELVYIIARIAPVGNPLRQVFTFYLPSLFLTVLVTPVCYVIIKEIHSRRRTADE